MQSGLFVVTTRSPMARRTHLRLFTGLTYLVKMDAFNTAVLESTNGKNGTSFRLFDDLNFW